MKKLVLLSMCISLFINPIFSQEQEEPLFLRNNIGIQFNPYLNEQFFNFTVMNTVSSLRYSYRISKNFTSGIEFSFNFPINIKNSEQKVRWVNYTVGPLSRYSLSPNKRFQIFGEVSPYYSHLQGKGINSPDFTYDKFGFYIAPGASFYSKNQKFSFDLYYKFSNLSFINGKKSVLSYKLNYNF